jgi:FkbM family methyltransferase
VIAQLLADLSTGRFGCGRVMRLGRRLRYSYLHRVGDPGVRYWRLGIRLPLSHVTPLWDTDLAVYDLALPRIAAALARALPGFTMIDVGANVGDTIARVRRLGAWPVLGIEGDPRFCRWLRENVRRDPATTLVEAFLGDRSSSAELRLEHSSHTSRLLRSPGAQVSLTTLDDVLDDHPAFRTSALIKTDTDGFELRVLRGGTRYLREARPVVFMEVCPYTLAEHGERLSDWLAERREQGYAAVQVFRYSGELEETVVLSEAPLSSWDKAPPWDPNRQVDLCLWPEERLTVAREAEAAMADLRGEPTWRQQAPAAGPR